MNTVDPQKIQVTRLFQASAERVFDAWLDPSTAGLWLFATDTGQMTKTEIDARVGGRFNLTERRNGEDVEHLGEYLAIVRPSRLGFSFAVPKYSAVYTRVTVEVTPVGAGCELVLTHEGVLPEWAEATQQGWATILGRLDGLLQRQLPG